MSSEDPPDLVMDGTGNDVAGVVGDELLPFGVRRDLFQSALEVRQVIGGRNVSDAIRISSDRHHEIDFGTVLLLGVPLDLVGDGQGVGRLAGRV